MMYKACHDTMLNTPNGCEALPFCSAAADLTMAAHCVLLRVQPDPSNS